MRKSIYLSGGMADISFEVSNKWRRYIEDELKYEADIFNPNYYYNYEHPEDFDSDAEVKRFDLYNLQQSDIVIVNFNVPGSIGTAYEVAVAERDGKPIIGLNVDHNELHPWLELACWKMFDNIDELIMYVKTYYLGGM